jgi:hypothetical protein
MPKRTIRLLEQLSALGFSDSDFCVVHHFPQGETIQNMLTYCRKIGSFRDGSTNERVRRRLQIVLTKFLDGDYPRPAPLGVFRSLCDAAVREIPK